MQEKTSLKFSQRFSDAIKHSGLKSKEIASKSSVSAGYISDLKSGKKDNPSSENVKKFSDILGCDCEWLLTGLGEMHEGYRRKKLAAAASGKRSAAIEAGLEDEIEALGEAYKSLLYQFPGNSSRIRKMFKKNIINHIDEFETWCDVNSKPKKKLAALDEK